MDDVGIVTLVHVRNIGAVLQAYATNSIIKDAGFNPVFIRAYGIGNAIRFFVGDMGVPRINKLRFLIEKNKKFNQSFKIFKEVNIKYCRKCRTVVLGSDSIWIPYNGKKRMPSAFFGNIENNNIVSFSASSGGIFEKKLYSSIQKKSLEKIKAISVRDEYTKQFIKGTINKEAEVVLDPTLLIDWKNLISNNTHERKNKGKYILVYGGINRSYADKVKRIANELQYQIVNVGTYNENFKINIAVSPFEFLYYMRDAALVFSSMFHGIMIAISFEKTFRYIPMNENRNKKLETIVEILEIDKEFDWLLKEDISVNGFNKNFDYCNVTKRKEKWALQSRDWLINKI